jgi:hypothetical protein
VRARAKARVNARAKTRARVRARVRARIRARIRARVKARVKVRVRVRVGFRVFHLFVFLVRYFCSWVMSPAEPKPDKRSPTNQNQKKEIEEYVQQEGKTTFPTSDFHDSHRQITSLWPAPGGRLVAAADNLGRVLVFDTARKQLVRLFKGHRYAQCGWIEMCSPLHHQVGEGDLRKRNEHQRANLHRNTSDKRTGSEMGFFVEKTRILFMSSDWFILLFYLSLHTHRHSRPTIVLGDLFQEKGIG